MAGGRQDVQGRQANEIPGEGRRVQALPRALPQGLCKQTVADWKDATADYVRTKLFDKQQFVSDEDLVMGGHIQKNWCHLSYILVARKDRDFSGRSKEG